MLFLAFVCITELRRFVFHSTGLCCSARFRRSVNRLLGDVKSSVIIAHHGRRASQFFFQL